LFNPEGAERDVNDPLVGVPPPIETGGDEKALLTIEVVASLVDASVVAGVGAVGVPVNAGDAKGAAPRFVREVVALATSERLLAAARPPRPESVTVVHAGAVVGPVEEIT
jgi:hypothetical protein